MTERISTVPDRDEKGIPQLSSKPENERDGSPTMLLVLTRKPKPNSRSMSRPKGMITATPI